MDITKVSDQEKLKVCKRFFYGESSARNVNCSAANYITKNDLFIWLKPSDCPSDCSILTLKPNLFTKPNRWLRVFAVSLAAQLLLVLQGRLPIGGIQRTESDQTIHQPVRCRRSSVGGDSDLMEYLFPAEPGQFGMGRQSVVCSACRLRLGGRLFSLWICDGLLRSETFRDHRSAECSHVRLSH